MYSVKEMKEEFTSKCPICDNSRSRRRPGHDFMMVVDCLRCGKFIIMASMLDLPAYLTIDLRSRASHAMRKMQRGKPPFPHLTDELIEQLVKEPLPNPRQKLERLILWIGDNQAAEHARAEGGTLAIAAHIGLSISDEADQESFRWLLTEAEGDGLFQAVDHYPIRAFRLTMKGWALYEELRRVRSESRKGFMAMKFNDPVLDALFETALKPGAQRAGFELYKLTENQPAGLIDAQLKAALLGARFVVADLSHKNDGAYWEAGFGEGRGIPVIYACEKEAWTKAKTHFDTNHMVTIIWDADNPKKAADDLTALLRNTFREDAKLDD